MSRFTVTLTDEINEKLQQLATEEGKTLSAVISEALELKFKIHDMNDQPKNEATKKMEELALKVPENVLRILAITSEILSCVYDKNAVKYKQETAAEELVVIKQKIRAYIEDCVNKEA